MFSFKHNIYSKIAAYSDFLAIFLHFLAILELFLHFCKVERISVCDKCAPLNTIRAAGSQQLASQQHNIRPSLLAIQYNTSLHNTTLYNSIQYHCSHLGPHLGTQVPMGTFFRFWVPKRSPLSPFQAENALKVSGNGNFKIVPKALIHCVYSVYSMKMAQTCAPNEATLCEGVFP